MGIMTKKDKKDKAFIHKVDGAVEKTGTIVGAGGGGLAGAGAGAVIGTVVCPGLGTAIGAGVGALAGGSAGGALGKLTGKVVTGTRKLVTAAGREVTDALGQSGSKNSKKQSEPLISSAPSAPAISDVPYEDRPPVPAPRQYVAVTGPTSGQNSSSGSCPYPQNQVVGAPPAYEDINPPP